MVVSKTALMARVCSLLLFCGALIGCGDGSSSPGAIGNRHNVNVQSPGRGISLTALVQAKRW